MHGTHCREAGEEAAAGTRIEEWILVSVAWGLVTDRIPKRSHKTTTNPPPRVAVAATTKRPGFFVGIYGWRLSVGDKRPGSQAIAGRGDERYMDESCTGVRASGCGRACVRACAYSQPFRTVPPPLSWCDAKLRVTEVGRPPNDCLYVLKPQCGHNKAESTPMSGRRIAQRGCRPQSQHSHSTVTAQSQHCHCHSTCHST